MKRFIVHGLVSALIASFSMAGAGVAQAAGTGDLPAVHSYQGVRYTSGGIGSDESDAMKAAASQWPLSLEFAVKAGSQAQYASGVQVRMRNQQGATVLDATSQGPFMLVKVPPGAYRIEATLNGKAVQRSVTVRSGHPTRAVFEWSAGMNQ